MVDYSFKMRHRRRHPGFVLILPILAFSSISTGIDKIINPDEDASTGIGLIFVGLLLIAGAVLSALFYFKEIKLYKKVKYGTDLRDAKGCIKQIRENPILHVYFEKECGLSFLSADDCLANLSRIVGDDTDKRNYLPFAVDDKEGVFSILDSRHVVYVDTDGKHRIAGINFRDYLEAAMLCRFPYDLSCRFENKRDFLNYVENLKPLNDKTIKELEKFRYYNRMTRTPEELYNVILLLYYLEMIY